MRDTKATEYAISRVEQAKRMILEASRTRLDAHLPTQEEIDRIRRVNEAMANLACLIDGLHNPDQGYPCPPRPA